jgi:hypothetical protein
MSENLLDLQIISYKNALELALQQKGSYLRGTVTEGAYTGKQGEVVEKMDAYSDTRTIPVRFGPKERQDVTFERRWVFPLDNEKNALRDSFDKLRVATDVDGPIVLSQTYALGRWIDDLILEAMFSDTAKIGENGTTSKVFGTSQYVGCDTGGADSSINYDKLLAGLEILRGNEVDLDNEPVYCAIGAKENTALMKDIQYISKEYGSIPVVESGKLKSFLGINFINTQRLVAGTDDTSTTSYMIPLYTNTSMHLGIWDGIKSKMSIRNELSGDPWQATASLTCGATRIDEKRIVKIWCRR